MVKGFSAIGRRKLEGDTPDPAKRWGIPGALASLNQLGLFIYSGITYIFHLSGYIGQALSYLLDEF